MPSDQTILCVAPHPDDETLGCGGSLLRHAAEGSPVHWLIMTAMHSADGFPEDRIAGRDREINAVSRAYGFEEVHRACLPTTRLDTLPKSLLVDAVAKIVKQVRPHTIYLPYRNDAHSDHAAVFDAVTACCKNFRYPYIRRVRVYETLSETEFGLRIDDTGFRPNLFVDVSAWIDRKVEIMRLFAGEMGEHPFPRSEGAIRALAAYRGVVAGSRAAEAFMTLREIE
jgi:N-acetylglucosamine malate deacetylase 1